MRGLPKPQHPLISLVDFRDITYTFDDNPINWILDFYSISLKKNFDGKVKYGQQEYDFDEGIMYFISPNQVFSVEIDKSKISSLSGWLLLIHPDFLWNTSLAKTIKGYEYFNYTVNEALFLSDKEEIILNTIAENIQNEYNSNIDKFSQKIIISQVETLLNYADRFYQRQFITRKKANHQILNHLEELLIDYFNNKNLVNVGLPTVKFIAETLNLSPNYLNGVLKSLTGQSTQQHIHDKLIEKAKEKLSTTHLTVSEIAFELGFEYSQSFSKLFKAKTKQSPLAFRKSFNYAV
ncbi:helix-turn-helix domain-containing protein [Flavihumibacter sp.]|uniref:helix-turn-helix domain-containing protein n=1 Tax=Flavihumibacter sp. TaxID=1913981 RepID=UPI002FC5F25A